jgi:hypothetical protein
MRGSLWTPTAHITIRLLLGDLCLHRIHTNNLLRHTTIPLRRYHLNTSKSPRHTVVRTTVIASTTTVSSIIKTTDRHHKTLPTIPPPVDPTALLLRLQALYRRDMLAKSTLLTTIPIAVPRQLLLATATTLITVAEV